MLWSRGPTPPTIVPIHRSPPVEAVALCTAVDAASFAEADVMSLAAAHTRNSILFRAALLQKDALGEVGWRRSQLTPRSPRRLPH